MNGLKRIMLKLSGEALSGDKGTGFDENTCIAVGEQIRTVSEKGTQVAIVTGGGNFWRGRDSSRRIERTHSDQIGMLGTVMNCMYVSGLFTSMGMKTAVYTPFTCGTMTKLFSRDEAIHDLEDGRIVFFAGGTGHPYFSTDTGTTLRALEIGADAILLAKSIDGIYDSDPEKNPQARKYRKLPIRKVVDDRLQAIDLTSSIMCLEHRMPLLVFGLDEKNSIVNALYGEFKGTYVTADEQEVLFYGE